VERTLQNPDRTRVGVSLRTRVLPGGYYGLVYFVEPAVDAVLVLSVDRRRSTLKKEGETYRIERIRSTISSTSSCTPAILNAPRTWPTGSI
jgi:hypothetical protein